MNVLTNITISITVCLLTIAAYHFQFARDTPKIITVDINQLIDEKIQTLTSNGQDESTNKSAIQAFGRTLEANIKQISKENHLIILPAQAVIAGVPDHTDIIKRRLTP